MIQQSFFSNGLQQVPVSILDFIPDIFTTLYAHVMRVIIVCGRVWTPCMICLLYTSDAADDLYTV